MCNLPCIRAVFIGNALRAKGRDCRSCFNRPPCRMRAEMVRRVCPCPQRHGRSLRIDITLGPCFLAKRPEGLTAGAVGRGKCLEKAADCAQALFLLLRIGHGARPRRCVLAPYAEPDPKIGAGAVGRTIKPPKHASLSDHPKQRAVAAQAVGSQRTSTAWALPTGTGAGLNRPGLSSDLPARGEHGAS